MSKPAIKSVMSIVLSKFVGALVLVAFATGFLYAQHCDYQDLVARYEAEKKASERYAKECDRLRKSIASQPKPQQTKKAAETSTVLAVANKNPLNVKQAATKWQGQRGIDEQGHIVFDNNVNGVRAAASVLMNYYHKHKLDTLNGIIDRFCTASKQRKAKYAKFVGDRMGLKPDAKFNVLQRLPELLQAMARFESGREWPQELFAPYSLLASAYQKGGE